MVGDLLKIDRIKMLLLENGISLEPGLSDEEIQKVETIYGIEFPEQWLAVYQQLLPISEGFYNWRDFSAENIEHIKRPMMEFWKVWMNWCGMHLGESSRLHCWTEMYKSGKY